MAVVGRFSKLSARGRTAVPSPPLPSPSAVQSRGTTCCADRIGRRNWENALTDCRARTLKTPFSSPPFLPLSSSSRMLRSGSRPEQIIDLDIRADPSLFLPPWSLGLSFVRFGGDAELRQPKNFLPSIGRGGEAISSGPPPPSPPDAPWRTPSARWVEGPPPLPPPSPHPPVSGHRRFKGNDGQTGFSSPLLFFCAPMNVDCGFLGVESPGKFPFFLHPTSFPNDSMTVGLSFFFLPLVLIAGDCRSWLKSSKAKNRLPPHLFLPRGGREPRIGKK